MMSANAGDVLLYVGGGAINAAFGGQNVYGYAKLHRELLQCAMEERGKPVLQVRSDGDDGDVIAACAMTPSSSAFNESKPSGLHRARHSKPKNHVANTCLHIESEASDCLM
eukprot:5471268-Amphidinium_carterae.1